MSEEFNLSRAEASATSEITATSKGVGFLLAGLLSDRYGSKRVIVWGTLITSLSLLMLGAPQTLQSTSPYGMSRLLESPRATPWPRTRWLLTGLGGGGSLQYQVRSDRPSLIAYASNPKLVDFNPRLESLRNILGGTSSVYASHVKVSGKGRTLRPRPPS
ncbi:MFS transporter [Candidatus Bathyarchaeota archaeon]|nr:MFS transporter [Candidatus Bathyarchaeota archaeon]MBS7630972.1 MFS transporter [Candidatus Bathyarchaeota archaeon]